MKELIRIRNMRDLFLMFLVGLCFIASCTIHPAEKPTLSDEILAQIMADLNVAEAATLGLSGYPKDSLRNVYFAQVFEIHNTSLDEYEKNLRIASADMQHFQQILLESIELLEYKNN